MAAELRQTGSRCGWPALVALPYLVLLIAVPPVGEFPSLDDFDYAATAWHLADTGHLRLSDWPAMTLVTHVVWGALVCKVFGNSFFVLRCSMFVLSLAAALAIFAGCRRQGHSREVAALGALCFAVNPLTVAMQYTFMTDITGAACCTWLIAAAPDPQRASRRRLLTYGCGAGLAYLARETALIPWIWLTLGVVRDCVRGRLAWRRVFWLAAPVAALIAAYEVWLKGFHGVPFNRTLSLLDGLAILGDPQRPLYLVTGLALAMLPIGAILLASSEQRGLRGWVLILGAGIVGAALVVAGFPVARPYRDLVFDLGICPPESPIDRIPPALRGPVVQLGQSSVSVFRAASTGLGWLLAAVIGAALFGGRRPMAETDQSRSHELPIAILTTLSLTALYLVTRGLTDRYLLSLLPVGILALAEVRRPPVSSRVALCAGWCAVLLVGAVTLLGIQDATSRSGSFWSAADRLRQRSVAPHDVDAGLAFGGMYRFNPIYRGQENHGPFWSNIPFERRDESVGAISPLTTVDNRQYRISFDVESGYRPIETVPFRSWFRSGDVTIYERDSGRKEQEATERGN